MKGFRHKAYAGASVLGVLGIGGAASWSRPNYEGDRVLGITFTLGAGLSPFLLDVGYNQGEVEYFK